MTYTPVVGPAITLLLVNEPDGPGDNYFATFSDPRVDPRQFELLRYATNCTTAPGPTCGANSNNAFTGAKAPGTFTLFVCDRVGNDLGTLIQWSVIVSSVTLPLDVDGNGVVEPLTDALLILRYSFGFRGATLIAGAVAGNCTRCSVLQIEGYLAFL